MILIAFHARVTDWQALQLAWHEICTACWPRLAQRMTLYRNGHDASKVLMLIEYPDDGAHHGAAGWQKSFAHCLDLDSIEEQHWELIEQAGWAGASVGPLLSKTGSVFKASLFSFVI